MVVDILNHSLEGQYLDITILWIRNKYVDKGGGLDYFLELQTFLLTKCSITFTRIRIERNIRIRMMYRSNEKP